MESPTGTWIVVATLAVWRTTHLLHAEDGPWDLFGRLRRLSGNGVVGRALDCFYCLSLWVSMPFALLLVRDVVEGVVLWLALSGGAVLLHRATEPRAAVPHWQEAPPLPPTSKEGP